MLILLNKLFHTKTRLGLSVFFSKMPIAASQVEEILRQKLEATHVVSYHYNNANPVN